MKPDIDKAPQVRDYRRLLIVPLFLMAIMFTSRAMAQGERDDLVRMIGEDRSTIDAIAGYDENIREDILYLTRTPEVLNIIEELQKKSEKKFRAIIRDYDRNGQAAMYEMARYPDLISELVASGRPSSSRVSSIVSNYPSDIRETAKKYARSHYEALREIDQLNGEIDREFQSYLSPYDEQTRTSVNVLLKYPEIVAILVEDKEFTRTLGNAYAEDPVWVRAQLETIAEELEAQNQKDLAEYKNQIQNDPEAYNEMLQAADKFSNESNITREYDGRYDPQIEINIVNSYPYWYGYPYWYPYAYWRPYPSYYHTGFYFGPGRAVIFVGLPSSHFIYWHTHYHPTLFPNLSYCYYNYYQKHYLPYRNHVHRPVSHYGFYHSVERNVINNPRVNNDNLVRIDRKRGNNIVRQPDINRSTDYSRSSARTYGSRTRTENGNILRPNSSVKRDAFPRTSPSPVRSRSSNATRQRSSASTSEGSRSVISGSRKYERPSGAAVNSGTLRSERPSGRTVISGERSKTGSSSVRGANPSTRSSETYRKPSGTQEAVRRSATIPQRGSTQAAPQPYRNYRNYKATESRQAAPSSSARRSPSTSTQRISPQSGRQMSSPGKSTSSRASGNRSSRER